MTQVVLPHTIDAGTEITAVEHQQNYVEIRDKMNGLLEGGGGADNNFKANGVTARELADLILLRGLPAYGGVTKEGLNDAPDLYISPGSGLVLNYAAGTAWVTDDSGVLSVGALIPATVVGGTVTIAANASGNPRIDQVILTMNGYGTASVSVLQGTATAGATLDNRTGAAALPSDAIRLADVLMPNGFAGPFTPVLYTAGTIGGHIRQRHPWAKPMVFNPSAAASFDITVDSTADAYVKMSWDFETSTFGDPRMFPENRSDSIYYLVYDGTNQTTTPSTSANAAGSGVSNNGIYLGITTVGSAGGYHWQGRGTFSIVSRTNTRIMHSNSANQSVTGSGNHAVSVQQLATAMPSSHTLSFLRMVQSGGTLTGRFQVERI